MTTISPTSITQQAPADRTQLRKAAQAFEAILVKQMLTAAHAASFGDKLFDSQGLQTFNTMQDERYAQITAESGTLGFAKMIEAQMAKRITGPINPAGGQ